MSSPEPTTSTRNVVTQDPHVAHDWLETVFADFQPEESNSSPGFRFRGRHLPLGDNGVLAQLRYSLSADNNLSNSDVLVVQPFDGGMKVSLGHDEEVVPVGTPVLFPAHQVVSVLWADACADCVGVRAAEVERTATETTGLENAGLRFTALRPMTPAAGRRWNDVVRGVVDTLMRQPGGTPSPLVAAQLTRRLAAVALETFPSTVLASRRRMPPDHATPPVVRRAIDVIEANADRDLTLSEIAEASGISARGLQAAFLRHRDMTPTAFARRVRLDRAHRELAAVDPALRDTVRSIPARWGFDDRRRFAVEHQRAYGRPPVQTARS
jgi:AraC-like DNA-binding protein